VGGGIVDLVGHGHEKGAQAVVVIEAHVRRGVCNGDAADEKEGESEKDRIPDSHCAHALPSVTEVIRVLPQKGLIFQHFFIHECITLYIKVHRCRDGNALQ
jgi:hypothetical protein